MNEDIITNNMLVGNIDPPLYCTWKSNKNE